MFRPAMEWLYLFHLFSKEKYLRNLKKSVIRETAEFIKRNISRM
jgi:hypothetical protein